MKRIAGSRRWLALLLLLALTPGVGEAVENFSHLLGEGHFAHAPEHGDEPSGSAGTEHGCSGTFHLCSCHSTLSFLKPHALAQIDLPSSARVTASAPGSLEAGFHRIPKQPPAAS